MTENETTETQEVVSEMPIKQAVEKVIKISRQFGEVARGLREAIKALERDQVELLIMAKDNDEPLYVQTLTALANEKNTPIIKLDSKMELGRFSGFYKVDNEGKPRKVVKCSAVGIIKWGQETSAKAMLIAETEKTK